ncbi:hypothetical protein Tco_0739910 [Tanacetum coccineum]
MKVEESLNVTFDKSPPPTKLSPLVDDDVGEEEAIIKNTKVVNNNNEEDESIKVDEIVNIKESKNHPLDQVIRNLNQRTLRYIKEMLKKFGLKDSKPTKTSMSTEIKLTKDDEADSVDSFKYRGMIENPKIAHLEAVKRIFRNKRPLLSSRSEAITSRKACQQALWMKQALIDYGIRLDDVPIMCDNKGAIDLSKNPVQHSRTKHVEIRHHFLRDNVQKANISIEKAASEDNIAYIFTKPLKREVFNYFRLGLGMMELIMDSDSSSSQK